MSLWHSKYVVLAPKVKTLWFYFDDGERVFTYALVLSLYS